MGASVDYLGSVAIGDKLHFNWSMRTAGGAADGWASAATRYQVRKLDGTLITTGDGGGTAGPGSTSTRTLTEIASGTYADIYASSEADEYTVSASDFSSGETGFILIMNTALTLYAIVSFRVSREKAISTSTAYIDTTAPGDGTAAAAPNTLLGRVWTIEKNQRDVIMPRLKRILGLVGENQLVDAYTQDDDGNIVECRVRIFDTKANRDAATPWQDVINDADPAASLEAGEIARYTILVSNLLPRNLRTVFQQQISTEAADSSYGLLGSGGGSIL